MKRQKLVLSRETIRPLDATALKNVGGASINDGRPCVLTTTRSDVSIPARCGFTGTDGCAILTTSGQTILPGH